MTFSNDHGSPKQAVDFKDAELFTSLRYDPILEDIPINIRNSTGTTDGNDCSEFIVKSSFYMLDYHRDRIVEAAEFLQWMAVKEALPDTATLETKLIDDMKLQKIDPNPAKVRFAIDQHGKISIGYMALPLVSTGTLFPTELSIQSLLASNQDITKVFVDNHTSPTGPATTYKTSKRAIYDSARARFKDVLPPGLGGEVLIVNTSGEILEATFTSVYFFRKGRWVTPPIATGPQEWKGQKGTTRRWALEKGLCVEEVVMKASVSEGEQMWLSNGARGFWIGRIVSSY